MNFPAGKLPKTRVSLFAGALPNEIPTVLLDHGGHDLH